MSSKNSYRTCDQNNKAMSAKNVKSTKIAMPKKLVQSKTLGYCPQNSKSCSTGAIYETRSNKRRNFTKSDLAFSQNIIKESIDFCKKCGDQIQTKSDSSNSGKQNVRSVQNGKHVSSACVREEINDNSRQRLKSKGKTKTNGVKQYYRNENFQSTDSIQEAEIDLRKISLDTIKEVPDASESLINIYDVISDSEEELGFMDTNDADNLDKIKKFRQKNYFECHSVKSRVYNKGNVTSLVDHKCAYRFYLNDRLFPVPLNGDYQDNVRCVECHLPIDLKYDPYSDKPNGTIQAKVKINNETQDMILMLPVNESLFIKEKRKQIREENEILYLGIIRLDTYGNSVFNSTLPSDSLALKYQKGYKSFGYSDDYKYKGVEKDDVIII